MQEGKRRHYKLGQWFRKRYQSLFPDGYSVNNTYVLSTDVDRTLMSAAVNLAGLFPPTKDQIWNEDLLWQPIPIHTTSVLEDTLLKMSKPCPRYETLYAEYVNSNETKTIHSKYKPIFPLLKRLCGTEIYTFYEVYQIYDVLLVEKLQNKT